jgi:hypothetical protein
VIITPIPTANAKAAAGNQLTSGGLQGSLR